MGGASSANTDSSGYHETLTVFYVRVIADYLEHTATEGASDAVLEADLIATRGARELPLEYYSRERLFSVEARRRWLKPDLKRLPGN